MVSKEEILKIAHLARLVLKDDEFESQSKKLSAIIEYVKQLQAVNVEGIPPMSHVHGSTNVSRPDEMKPSMDISALSSNCPDMNGRFIRVPLIVE